MRPSTKNKCPTATLDASQVMQGELLGGEHITLHAPWWKIVTDEMKAACDLWLTPAQIASSNYCYAPQPDGRLFCALVVTDGSNIAIGMTVPGGRWERK